MTEADATALEAILLAEAALPAASASDGQSATGQSLAELQKLLNKVAGAAALEGSNSQGGKRSAWGALRAAKVIPPGAP